MKTHNNKPIEIDRRVQHSINTIVLRNIDRLDLNSGQRAAIVLVLCKPAKQRKARKKHFGGV
jgi:hypothetical protein